jgi:hypothetical protein
MLKESRLGNTNAAAIKIKGIKVPHTGMTNTYECDLRKFIKNTWQT